LKIFRHFDADSSGSISRQELADVLQKLEPGTWNDDALDLLLTSVDTGADGAIQYEEFVAWLFAKEGNEIVKRSRELISRQMHLNSGQKKGGGGEGRQCGRRRQGKMFNLGSASEEERDNTELVRQAVARKGKLLHCASDRLRDDFETCLLAVRQYPTALEHCSARLQCDPRLVRAAVAKARNALQYASPELRDDPDLVRAALKKEGCALRWASVRLRGDRELVLLALAESSQALTYASEELKADKGFALQVYEKNPGVRLGVWSSELRDDPDVARAAFGENGQRSSNFSGASDRLRSDPDFVKWAVERKPEVIRIASPEMRDNVEVMRVVVTRDPQLFSQASMRARSDPELALAAVEGLPGNLGVVPDEQRRNAWLVKAAVSKDGAALKFALVELRDDEELVLSSVQNEGLALEHASSRLKDDQAIVHTAVSQNGKALEFASERLRDDLDIVKAAMGSDEAAVRFASSRVARDPSMREALRRVSPHSCGTTPITFRGMWNDVGGQSASTLWHFPLGLREGMPAHLLHSFSESYTGHIELRSSSQEHVVFGSVAVLEPPYARAVIEWERHVTCRSWHHYDRDSESEGCTGWTACAKSASLRWRNLTLASVKLEANGKFTVPEEALSLLKGLETEMPKVLLQVLRINEASAEGQVTAAFSGLSGDTLELAVSRGSSVELVAAELGKKRGIPASVRVLLVGKSGELLDPAHDFLDTAGSQRRLST